jgi:hypothetical protein
MFVFVRVSMFVFVRVLMPMPVFMPMFVSMPVGMRPRNINILARFLRAADGNGEPRTGYAALDGRRRGDADARKPEGVHFFKEGDLIARQLEQRRSQHIPRRAHIALDVQRSHRTTFLWFI